MNEILWCEKYRPRTIDETILPDRLKTIFKEYVKKGEIPNMLLSGTAGTGKTTVAKAMLEEAGNDYYLINGSLNGDMDTLRNEILSFASTISFSGKRKFVIIDEADYLTPKVMASLRGFIEEFSSNAGFILTCNFKDKIIEPLQSRCPNTSFNFTKEEKTTLGALFFKSVCSILDKENVTYDKKSVAEVVKKYYPDGRRIIGELQKYASSGSIDSGILATFGNAALKELIPYMRDRNFTSVRTWVGTNSDMDSHDLYRAFYDYSHQYFKPSSIPFVVVTIADYQFKDAFVADKEINLAACLIDIMKEAEFL